MVALALAEGHEVTAFVHNNDPFAVNPKLTVIKGDIGDRSAVAAAIAGSDAVISTLGSWGTKNKNILTLGMESVVPAMEELSIRRLVTLTGTAALSSDDQPTVIDRLSHSFLGTIAPKILQDGEAHLRLLEASNLEWTTLRSPAMTGSDKDRYHLDLRIGSPLARVPRAAVAKALLDQLNAIDFVRQAPVIHSR